MRLAFCLFKYYPYGGLERDFLRIAKACQQRGHTIDVYTMRWQGDIPFGFNVNIIHVNALTNHQRCKTFSTKLQNLLQQQHYDSVIGFNRMPGLDIYYAADPCYVAATKEKHGRWYRLTSRYRVYAKLEQAVFNSNSGTRILLLTPKEKSNFIQYYGTAEERFYSLPPGVATDRILSANKNKIRQHLRQNYCLTDENKLILMIGSDFKRKGVDRALIALSALPQTLRERTKLIVLGKGNIKLMLALAKKLKVSNQVNFLGGVDNVIEFLASADLLLHPARQETAGMVLLEALVAQLPVLVTANCGYAFYIEQAQAGLLINNTSFNQQELNEKLAYMLSQPEAYSSWKQNAANYTNTHDLFSMPEKVVDIIEQTFMSKMKS